MKTVEKEHCHLFDRIFPASVIAGFTKPTLQGDPEHDMANALLFMSALPQSAHLKQIHSAQLHMIREPGLFQGDGLFTTQAYIALVVKTADCLPVFLYSEALGVLGLVHMGWRGAKEGILDGITKILNAGDLSTFKVIAGVGLRSCCYEVSSDFRGYPQFDDFLSIRDERLMFDPIAFAKHTLFRYGIRKENFFDLNICSVCSHQKYYSHRRDKTRDRTLSFIVKT